MKHPWRAYGYFIAVQALAILGYMQLHIGEPKSESYWLGIAVMICNAFLVWCAKSPDNSIKRWQVGKDDV